MNNMQSFLLHCSGTLSHDDGREFDCYKHSLSFVRCVDLPVITALSWVPCPEQDMLYQRALGLTECGGQPWLST